MTDILIHWIILAIALIVVAKLVKGFRVSGFGSAFFAAILLGFLNSTVRYVLIFLTFPITIITLGLFLLVINGAVLKLAAAFIPGFEIDGWLPAIFGSVILSLLSSFMFFALNI